jgi:anti-anti-sigma factor
MSSRPETPSLDVSFEGDRAVVRMPAPHFGSVEAEAADSRLLGLVGELEQTLLALDFGDVSFMSSLGLALLLTLHKRLAESGRRLAVVNLQPHIYEVFSVTRLDTVLDVRPQEAA